MKWCLFLPTLGIMTFPQGGTAQEVVASQGGFVPAGNILYTFTIGESSISTLSNVQVLVTQGFQQPSAITVAVQDPPSVFNLKAFPNPTEDAVTVTYEGKVMHFGLYESTGRLLFSMEPNPATQEIKVFLSPYPAGVYILRAENESGQVPGLILIVKQ